MLRYYQEVTDEDRRAAANLAGLGELPSVPAAPAGSADQPTQAAEPELVRQEPPGDEPDGSPRTARGGTSWLTRASAFRVDPALPTAFDGCRDGDASHRARPEVASQHRTGHAPPSARGPPPPPDDRNRSNPVQP
jgi:hypothetical protein